MCTGLEIAGMIAGPLLSTVGAMVQQSEVEANNKRMAEARNERLQNTLQKNDKLAQDSREAFNQRQQAATAGAIEDDRAKETQERQDTIDQAVQDTAKVTPSISLAGSAPKVVQDTFGKKMSEAIDYGRSQAQKQATLGGYGDAWLGQGFKDVDTGRQLNEQANFAQGNMAILPYQQDIAETRAYKPISPIGGLLQGFGSMIGSAGGSGGIVPKKNYKSAWM